MSSAPLLAEPPSPHATPRLPAAARRLLTGTALSALGNGLVLPFLVVYLHDVRGMSTSVAGLVIAWQAVIGFAIAPLAGALIDQVGPRRVVVVSPLVMAGGAAGYALVQVPWQAFTTATVLAVGGAAMWPGVSTLMARIVPEEQRQRAFGLQFMLLNLGIGLGGLISGLAVDTSRPITFERLYLVDGLTFLLYGLIVSTLRDVGGPLPATKEHEQGGYRDVLRDRAMLRLSAVALVLLASGYGALELGYPAFVTQVLHVAPRVIAFGFVANTLAIVLGQMFAIRLIQGRSRSRVLATVGVLWAVSWGVLGLAVPISTQVVVVTLVLVAPVVFALGETIFQPVMPALVNELAPAHLRGRYNAMSSLVWNVAGVVGPAIAGLLLGAHLGGLWIAVVAGGCLVAGAAALRLRRALTPAQDGLLPAEVG
ncbi:MAG TPA: MFS transporter [Actinomycetes bacterium]